MATYAFWNNKGGVGKSYLTFQVACEYARQHPAQNVLVIDACPQANSSIMLLGGIIVGESNLDELATVAPLKTISGYIEDRIRSPYVSLQTGTTYVHQVRNFNAVIPRNDFLYLETSSLRYRLPAYRVPRPPGPTDAWRLVHQWLSDLIADITTSWDRPCTVFIDCNPSFTVYTEMALSASDRIIVPFTADGSSKRAVRALLALVYGIARHQGAQQSQFFLNSNIFRMTIPNIYSYVGNRLTQNIGAASAFRTVVTEIGDEIFKVWQSNPNRFVIHPAGAPPPRSRGEFKKMFQAVIADANTASVVSGALGIPMHALTAGSKNLIGKSVTVNQSQLDNLGPNLENFVRMIE